MGSGVSMSDLPDHIDRDAARTIFSSQYDDHIFDSLKGTDGLVTKSTLLNFLGKKYAIRGSIIHSLSFSDIEVIGDGAIVYGYGGVIEKVLDLSKDGNSDELSRVDEILDFSGKLIIPGFVDAHVHAPQYAFTGTGMDLPLLKWLETYTFPCESHFSDPAFAESVYRKAVRKHLKSGTTFASYFATIYNSTNKLLVKIIQEYGQRAYIGKVSMDRNAPNFYIEQSAQSIDDNEEFIRHVLSLTPHGVAFLAQVDANVSTKNDLKLLNKLDTPVLLPVITPRFVPSCTKALMTKLGDLAEKYKVPVQSHLCESRNEIKWCLELHPEEQSYTDIYNSCGLLTDRSYMAHCCYCTPHERDLLRRTKTGIVHCPCSNFMIMSGTAGYLVTD